MIYKKKSGSFEFTGAALALHSQIQKPFTATVSVDGWIRGQPTEVIMQKIELEKEEPNLYYYLEQMFQQQFQCIKESTMETKYLYIITDGSDEEYAI